MFEPTAFGRWAIQLLLIGTIGVVNFLSLRWIRKEVTTIKEEVVEYVDYVKTHTGTPSNVVILSPYEFPDIPEPVTVPISRSK